MAALLAAFMTCGVSAGPPAVQTTASSILNLLPAAAGLEGWAPKGEPQLFSGEALFEYIDGGAEIYHEYGFREVAVQDYRSPGGRTVSLEVFEMASPAAAFGMFTFKRSGEGPLASFGTEGELESYYLNFWRDRYLVTITGFDEDPGTVAGLSVVGRAVSDRIAGEAARPDLVSRLPAAGLRPRSLRYFVGRLGLDNIRAFFSARAFPAGEGVRGVYEDGTELFVFRYASAEVARIALAEMRTGFASDARYRDAGAGRERPAARYDGPFGVLDDKGRALAAAARDAFVLLATGESPEGTTRFLESALKGI
jgi:hypothetical protein